MITSASMLGAAGVQSLGPGDHPGDAPSSQVVERDLERLLFRKLLELTHEQNVESLLRSALETIAELASARHGYLEIRDPYRPTEPKQGWTFGTTERSGPSFEDAISSGVIQDAISSGETIVTLSAMTDPRFQDRESVQQNEISAVLCAPIGRSPAFGVIYLEGRILPGPFTETDRQRSELCASQLAVLADRLMMHRRDAEQHRAHGAFRDRMAASGLVGSSPAMHKAVEQLAIAAPLEVSVLLSGATGSGKSLFARALHENSSRSLGPFVEVNCATLPDTLVESELFGWNRGAHSMASSGRAGKVAAAEGGTLFLDEVAELSWAAQAKLLQLLQSKTYYALGSTQLMSANIRVIAATHQDLKQRVRERSFREDLFYRLRVFPLHVPSLDERPEDIAPLVRQSIGRVCSQQGWPMVSMARDAMRAIQSRRWPGNVRELENIVETAVIRACVEQASQIELRHVQLEAEHEAEPAPESLHEASRRFQYDLLKRNLEEVDWNIGLAAARLGIARSYLYKLIHAHQLRSK